MLFFLLNFLGGFQLQVKNRDLPVREVFDIELEIQSNRGMNFRNDPVPTFLMINFFHNSHTKKKNFHPL